MTERSLRLYKFALFLSDTLAILFALWVATQLPLPEAMQPYGFGELSWLTPPAAVLAMVIGFWSMRGYQLQRVFRIADETALLLMGTVVGMGIFAGYLFFFDRDVARLLVFYFSVLTPICAFVLRVSCRFLFKWRQIPRIPTTRVLIVGAGSLGRELGRQLSERSWLGLKLVGYIDDREGHDQTLGRFTEIERVCRREGVDVVIVTLSLEEHRDLARLLGRIHALPVQIKLVPDLYPLAYLYSRLEMFGGIPLLGLAEPVISPWQAAVKRAMDIAISVAGLIVTAPLMFLIGLGVQLTSSGPVIFSQERVGEGGKLFRMYKFRTMVENAEQMLLQQVRYDETALVKRANDPRVTPLGRWLRRFSLDELPQLWNVLRGDMSIVGPRPEIPYLVERYEPWQRKRLVVPQGITGWWQINGRSDKPMLYHTEDDLYYIRNFSLLLDLEILWKTIWVVLRGKGAY